MPFETGAGANPRINSARMSLFAGERQHVRLPCKVTSLNGMTALVEACDGGQITVKNASGLSEGQYYEVVGKADDATTLTLAIALPMEQELDMKLVDNAINFYFDTDRYAILYFKDPS